MAIRIFINSWREEPISDGLYIKDPIDEYLNDVSLSAKVTSQNFYAKISANGRPDKFFNLKFMQGDLQPVEWASLADLANVRMIPPHRFDMPIGDIRKNIRNQILTTLDSLGIPTTVFTSAATVGGFLRNLQGYINPDNVGFGASETDPAEWE